MDAEAYAAAIRSRMLGEARRKYARRVVLPSARNDIWRQLGDDHYSLIPPAQGPGVDPVQLRRIHDFDPGAIPLWRRQVWRSPEGRIAVFVCIGIGRHEPHAKYGQGAWSIDVPRGYSGPVPNIVELWWKRRRQHMPDAPRRFDGELVRHLRLAYNLRRGAELAAEIKEGEVNDRDRRLSRAYADFDERDRHFHREMSKMMAGRTLEELVGMYVAARQQRRPMVHVRGVVTV